MDTLHTLQSQPTLIIPLMIVAVKKKKKTDADDTSLMNDVDELALDYMASGTRQRVQTIKAISNQQWNQNSKGQTLLQMNTRGIIDPSKKPKATVHSVPAIHGNKWRLPIIYTNNNVQVPLKTKEPASEGQQ